LSNVLEELEVSSEELSQQNEELHATRHELEQRSQAYWELFQLAPDAYVVTSTETAIREANTEAANLLATRVDRLAGRVLAMYVPEASRSAFRRNVLALAGGAPMDEWVFPVKPRGRANILVSARVTVARDANGAVTGLRWLLRDITAATRAQQVLQQAYANTTADMAQLREVDQWKNAFLAAAAHDLRAPLTVIGGAAELLLRSPDVDREEDRQLAEGIVRHTTRLDELIRDLLDLDRFTRGAVQAERSSTNLVLLANGVVDSLDGTDHPIAVSGDEVAADVDARRVEQVVANLVRNAVGHTPAGTPIRVIVSSDEDAATITVEDEGPGIPEHLRESLFLPFTTEAAHDADGGGSGIGLSLVRLFAVLHGGDVRYEDRPGGGARFVVELPADPDST
jgi:PAS domain S-box-containing protein